jgi:hypothetical protein
LDSLAWNWGIDWGAVWDTASAYAEYGLIAVGVALVCAILFTPTTVYAPTISPADASADDPDNTQDNSSSSSSNTSSSKSGSKGNSSRGSDNDWNDNEDPIEPKPNYESQSSARDLLRSENPWKLNLTHGKMLSNKDFSSLTNLIRNSGKIYETIKVVNHLGEYYVVDGNHRVMIARMLHFTTVIIEEVFLPYGQYLTPEDLLWPY